MSSTNRSDARDLHKSDYYVTPIKPIEDFLKEFININQMDKDIKILDPCSGGDENHPMSYPVVLNTCGFNNIDTVDIREDSLANIKANYLELDCKNKYDMIITNPPFNIAFDIIKKALDDVKDNGYVIMLLRLNTFGGQLRKQFWEECMPQYAFVHNKRISFTDDNKTDSIEYMHCCWQKGNYKEFTNIKVI